MSPAGAGLGLQGVGGGPPGADVPRLGECRPLRGLAFALTGADATGPGADATRLMQCRPLRGLALPLRWGSRHHTWG